MIGKTVDQISIGDSAEFAKTISEGDIYLYAGITGDVNPAHINEEYAKTTFFKSRIAHGMLLGGLISTVIGNRLPGNGTIYITQELEFVRPVRIGDTVTAKVIVTRILPEKNRVFLKTICTNERGETVVDGEAQVSPPKNRPTRPSSA